MRDDLFEALRTPPPVDPLPATEVRRRGDRQRRRRTAFQVVGAAAVVAVIAGGALTIANGVGQHREAPPMHPKTEGTAPRIRADFPLAAGWPEPGGDGRLTKPSRSVDQIEWFRCGIDKVSGFGDRLGTEQVIGDAGYGRDLYTFGSDAAAATAYSTLRQQLEACRTWQDENGATYSIAPMLPGDDSSFQLAEWNEAVYAGSVFVTHRGRALLVDVVDTEGHGRQMAEQVAIDQLDQVAPVTHVLCEFTAEGCDGILEPAGGPSLKEFPLTAGWPSGAEVQPMKDGPEPFNTCGVRLDELPRAVGWRGLRLDGEGARQLFFYDDATTAQAVLDRAMDKACTKLPTEGEAWRMGDVQRSNGPGTELLTQRSWYELSNHTGVKGGVEATHLARNGRVVLVSSAFGEGTGRDDAERLASTDLTQLEPALEALEGLGGHQRLGPDKTPMADADLLTTRALQDVLADHAPVEGAGSIAWKQEQIRDVLTFGCGNQVADLDGLDVVSRDWTARGAEARTVVATGDAESTRLAFDRLGRALTACTGSEALHPVGEAEGRDGTDNGSAWRVFTTAAPEICTSCDTGRLVGLGVAKIGNRLVLVRVDLVVDLQLVGTDTSWVDAVLEKASARLT